MPPSGPFRCLPQCMFDKVLCWSWPPVPLSIMFYKRECAVENRTNRRYRLNAMVNFVWKAANGGGGQAQGTTRDIGASSAYIVTANQLPSGTSVQMIVTLPALDGTTHGPQLSIEARVVRSDRFGFAVTGNMGFQLESQDSQQRDCHTPAGEDKGKEERLLLFPGLRTSVS